MGNNNKIAPRKKGIRFPLIEGGNHGFSPVFIVADHCQSKLFSMEEEEK